MARAARWFDGWRDHDRIFAFTADPTRRKTQHLALTPGWRRHGLLHLDAQPASHRQALRLIDRLPSAPTMSSGAPTFSGILLSEAPCARAGMAKW